MSKLAYLFAAYSAIWAAVLIYLVRLGMRRRALEARVDSLERAAGSREEGGM